MKDTHRQAQGFHCTEHSTTEAVGFFRRFPGKGSQSKAEFLGEWRLHHRRSYPAE